jgi:hypothetical protein
MDPREPSMKSAHPDTPVSSSTSGARRLRIQTAARHDVLHLVLATSGAVMLAIAFLDWIIHPLTLWTALP